MQQVYNRALVERIVPMEVGGRVAAAVLLCPDGARACTQRMPASTRILRLLRCWWTSSCCVRRTRPRPRRSPRTTATGSSR